MIGWLLDTNVISEIASPKCDPRVAAWARGEAEDRLFISILSLGEYDKGIANLPLDAAARQRFGAAVLALEMRFAGRIVSLSDAVVRRWGRISGETQRIAGKAPPVIDTLLAAAAVEHDLYLVTRNIKDVCDSGAAIFDPWADDPVAFPLSP